MALIETIEQFNPKQCDVKSYIEKIDQFFISNKVYNKEKVPLFLSLVGEEACGILKGLLAPSIPKKKSYHVLKTTMINYYSSRGQVIAERYKFNNAKQNSTEDIETYKIKLIKLSENCKFGDFLDQALRDKFICGLKYLGIKQKLLTEDDDLSFDRACEIAIEMEASYNRDKLISDGGLDNVNPNTRKLEKKLQSSQTYEPYSNQTEPLVPNEKKCKICRKIHGRYCPKWRYIVRQRSKQNSMPQKINNFDKDEFAAEDYKKTEKLYRKVRSLLNKLTPQKFDTLLSQIKSLKINTSAQLRGVTDLVFEQAVDDPNNSVAYALMCKELAIMEVPSEKYTEEKPDFVNFRKLLITRCQIEFEKQSVDESFLTIKVKEIKECTDPVKKKDLQLDLDDYDRRLRKKTVGNIRFIGELFKQGMLTVNIMMRCLNNLLGNKDDESLECLCVLLNTIGKELEENHDVNLNSIFTSMKNLADKKEASKITNRVRFMLQDVIELKNSKWVSRSQDLNPKTMEQIQKDAENGQMNQILNVVQITPRKDNKMGGSGNTNTDRKRQGGRSVSNNEGWITSSSNRGRTPFSVQSDKLKSKVPTIDEPLGSPAMFGSWGKGIAIRTGVSATPENMNTEKRILDVRSKNPHSSKSQNTQRNYAKYKRQTETNDSLASSSQSTSATIISPARKPVQVVQTGHQMQMTTEEMDKQIGNSLDEFVSGNCSVDEFYQEVSSCIPIEYHPKMVTNCYLRVFGKSQDVRLKTGDLFAKLITANMIQLEDYCIGLEEILSQSNDLRIDIPKFWDYFADILVEVICAEVLSLNKLQQYLSNANIESDYIIKFLAPLFKLIVNKKGNEFLQSLWESSGLNVSDFIDDNLVDGFIEDNQLQFLVENSKIRTKLTELLINTSDFEEIVSWITANVGEKVKNSKFIRILATAIFEDCINKNDMNAITERLKYHNKLLLKYVDENPRYEVECLYALQALIHRLGHPQGLLLLVCNELYELRTFYQESFIAWEESSDPAEQIGKEETLKQLVSFFTQLKENDDEESSEDDA